MLDVPLPQARLNALIAQNDARPSPPCVAEIEDLRDAVDDLVFLIAQLNPSNVWQAVSACTKAFKAIEDAREMCAAVSGGVV